MIAWIFTVHDVLAAGTLIVPVSKGFLHEAALGSESGPHFVGQGLTVNQAGVEEEAVWRKARQNWLDLLHEDLVEVLEFLHHFGRAVSREAGKVIDATQLCSVVQGVEDKDWSWDKFVIVLEKCIEC